MAIHSMNLIFPVSGKNSFERINTIIKSFDIPENGVIYDPGCFSGTIPIEANILGYDSIGSDISKLSIYMTKIKTQLLHGTEEDLQEYKELRDQFIDHKSLPFSSFQEVDKLSSNKLVSNLLGLTFTNLIGYSKRGGKNKSFSKQLQFVSKEYIDLISKFYEYRDKIGLIIGKTLCFQGDARKNILKPNIVDAVIFSPPYMDTIKYPVNDYEMLKFIDEDLSNLNSRMIGIRGNNEGERIGNYIEDMKQVANNLIRVVKDDGNVVVLVADEYLTIDNKILPYSNMTQKIFEETGLKLEYKYKERLRGYGRKMSETVLIYSKS